MICWNIFVHSCTSSPSFLSGVCVAQALVFFVVLWAIVCIFILFLFTFVLQLLIIIQTFLVLNFHRHNNVIHVARSSVFSVMFCRSLFFLFSFFFWSLYCLSFDLRLMILQTFLSNYRLLCGADKYCCKIRLVLKRLKHTILWMICWRSPT